MWEDTRGRGNIRGTPQRALGPGNTERQLEQSELQELRARTGPGCGGTGRRWASSPRGTGRFGRVLRTEMVSSGLF